MAAHDESMKHRLSSEEEEAVRMLREKCDAENVQYESIFELAKYVLVCHSSVSSSKEQKIGIEKAKILRRDAAYNRIKKRRKYEKTYKLEGMRQFEKVMDSLEKIEHLELYAAGGYDELGRRVIEMNFSKIRHYSSSLWRAVTICGFAINDLMAVDLAESRKGFVVLIDTQNMGIRSAIKLQYLAATAHINKKEMNPHRCKEVFVQVPTFLHNIVSTAKTVFPSKFRERVKLADDLNKIDGFAVAPTQLPRRLGGTYDKSMKDFIRERYRQFDESNRVVNIN